MFLSIWCDNNYLLSTLIFLKIMLFILFILTPILYSFLLYITGVKNKKTSKKKSSYINKIKHSLILSFIFLFFVTCFNFITFNSESDLMVCINSSNSKYIKELSKYESEKNTVLEKQKSLKSERDILNNDNYVSGAFIDDILDGSTVKVLMVGNSLTYMNGYGEILTRMAKVTGKKMVVVSAVRGGRAGQGYNLVNNALEYTCWSSNTNDCSSQSGRAKLKDIVKIDFANQDRDSWDYIIVQNYIPSKKSNGRKYSSSKRISILKGSDMALYNAVKYNLVSSDGFIINLNRQSKYRSKHVSVLSNFGGSLVDTWHIISKYPKYKSSILLKDKERHLNVNGAYLCATIIYSKIYGVDNLYVNDELNDFIPLYGDDTLSNYHPKPKKGRKCVSESTAKKIQTHVYNYYDKYVLYY